ncbi:leucine-rich repeat domain-containing protein [uncultured Bacteroides sp.]|uniref:leucine-rich repeat domain-containing protein n=1 Tax=uncultured Bacteroides sp. TaxID=162156 RepID=UPI002AAAE86B|nr:leucine-rich repeat domain-containing protein [uncultured Bacteroides sp.]
MKTSNYFKSLFVITSLLLSLGLQAQVVSDAVNVQTAGTLSSLIPATDKYQITSLTVTGDLNGTDIRYIREMAGRDVNGSSTLGILSVLDLSGANIVAGGSSYYYDYTTSLNEIGDAVFDNCTGLTSITIPKSVTSIGRYAFYYCTGLTSITIPNSVISIGSAAFDRCTKLEKIIVSENNPAYNSIEGVLLSKDCTELIAYPNAKSNIYTLPNSVTSIGDDAFYCTGLTSITIPDGVTSIGIHTFIGCTKLKEFIVSENNPAYNSVEGVLFSKDCTKLIVYPNAKSNIYTLPNSVTSIGDYAFYCCTGLASITISNSVTSIKSFAFAGCSGLTSITIPNSVTSIGESAFSHCIGLTLVTIPNSVTSIGSAAFSGCTGLTLVAIPYNVTSFENSVFYNCKGITEIHCKILTPPNVDYRVFYGINKTTCKLYIPKGTYSNYLGATGWRDFTNIIEEEATAISQTERSNVKVYTDQGTITVTGADLGDYISVYTESGALLQTTKVTDNTIRITVPLNKIYLIKTAGKVFKVAL